MMKQWAIALSVTMMSGVSMAAEAPSLNVMWGSYLMKDELPNEDLVSQLHPMIVNFHMTDMAGKKAALPYHSNNLEIYRQYMATKTQSIAARLNGIEARYLSISKNGALVGGAFYSLEQGGTVVNLQLAGFIHTLPLIELHGTQQQMMGALSSKANFPGATTLVVYLHKNDFMLAPLLLGLGYTKGVYQSVDHPDSQYQAYMKAM